MPRKAAVHLIAIALLLLMFAQVLGSARLKSPTMDEQNHIARGLAYLRTGDLRLSVEHPPLVNALCALPLLLCPQIKLPLDHPSWQNGAWYVFADEFLWRANAADVDLIVFLARLPVMGLSLLLGALAYRWAKELAGVRAGLVALFLVACDPNILAHARLATTDLGVAVFSFLAIYTFWQALRGPGFQPGLRITLAGVALGLALTAKFSALLLCPLFCLLALWALTRRTLRPALVLVIVFALATLTLWAVYGFEFGPLNANGPPLPAPSYLRGVQAILRRTEGGNPAFLLGRYSMTGWWYYFPVAFLIKTPIPTLLLFCASLVLTARQRAWGNNLCLLLPAAAFFTVNLFSHLNIGYRHLLPVLPFVFVYIASSLAKVLSLRKALLSLLAAWYLVSALLIYPDHLAYFNELIGGPANGYRWLVDSNLDWGQDLPGLRRYVEAHGLTQVYLSWFGSARPEHYGIPARSLPGYPLYQGEAEDVGFNPYHPAPGIYAISASNLQGVALRDRDTFLWFRQRQPTARIGYSIFVYEVPPEENVGAVCLGDSHLRDLDAETVDTLLRRNVHIKAFNPATSLIWPGEGQAWLIASRLAPFAPELHEMLSREGQVIEKRETYYVLYLPDTTALEEWLSVIRIHSRLWWNPATSFPSEDPLRDASPLTLPVDFGHRAALWGYQGPEEPLSAGDTLNVLTVWRVLAEVNSPPAIFVHLLDAAGHLVAGWDGLDVASSGWEPGDVFAQMHHLEVPADAPSGNYLLEVGVYSPETLERWPVFAGEAVTADRALLTPVTILPNG
ncbi:MAG: phospholipid carrier-dependent glycosyltransferase [Anaerolineae bacterium]|nr:phospholipid carrier-dependent glycosyltransferase [Anaerolineae bacterium]